MIAFLPTLTKRQERQNRHQALNNQEHALCQIVLTAILQLGQLRYPARWVFLLPANLEDRQDLVQEPAERACHFAPLRL